MQPWLYENSYLKTLEKSYVDKADVVLSVNDVWEAYLCNVDLWC